MLTKLGQVNIHFVNFKEFYILDIKGIGVLLIINTACEGVYAIKESSM
jgi:hypothetical protein